MVEEIQVYVMVTQPMMNHMRAWCSSQKKLLKHSMVSTLIVSSRKSKRDGSIVSRRLMCNREGFNLNRQKHGQARIRKRETSREGCLAMILVKIEKLGNWVVSKFFREHSHSLAISSEKCAQTPDEKDMRIRELSSKLHDTKQRLAACQEQLSTCMTYIVEYNHCLSTTIDSVLNNIRATESTE